MKIVFLSSLLSLLLLSCQTPTRALDEMKFQPGKKKVFILVSEQISSFEVVKNSFMEKGKIAEERDFIDNLELMQQLGQLPRDEE